MFGYATDETPECMPLTLQLAHQMNKKIADLRRDGTLWWARPDSKTQVMKPSLVISHLHAVHLNSTLKLVSTPGYR